jgi:hypothetical protein
LSARKIATRSHPHLRQPAPLGGPTPSRPDVGAGTVSSAAVTRDPRNKTLTDPQREDVERYVRTGESDLLYSAWPGDVFRRGRIASEVMREALVDEVHRRVRAAPDRRGHPPLNDLVGLTRRRVEPMVRGLFPGTEQDPVLQVLERSVVVLTAENITSVLRETRREWPLDIAFDKREMFAYSCEAFSRLLEHGSSRQARFALVRELTDGHVPGTDHLDEQEYVSILTEAAGARKGWKRILSRCAPPPRHRRR